jgi:hypothetical protein
MVRLGWQGLMPTMRRFFATVLKLLSKWLLTKEWCSKICYWLSRRIPIGKQACSAFLLYAKATVTRRQEYRRVASIPIFSGSMRKRKNAPNTAQIKDEIRTWYRFERPLGEIIHNRRFFFAWKDGCLMGTYNTLEEATDSLTPREMRRTQ